MVVYFILVIKGKCLSSKICWSVVRVGRINWRVARIGICCLKLEPDLFTLALKQVEMSHLATFKLLRSCFETKKIRQSVWWDTILIS